MNIFRAEWRKLRRPTLFFGSMGVVVAVTALIVSLLFLLIDSEMGNADRGVVSVLAFDDEADAIRKANDTEFGLSGSIWTNNSGKAIRVARAVESGNLSVNSNSSVRYWTPFGGYKQSGLGRELGPDALDSFTEVKNVFIATDN